MEIELSFTTDEIRTLRAALGAYQNTIANARPPVAMLETNPRARELNDALVAADAKVNALFRKMPLVKG